MNYFLNFTIIVYQKCISPCLKNMLGVSSYCRFHPSCSAYAKEAIKSFGIVTGVFLAAKRIIRCNPFGGFGLDSI